MFIANFAGTCRCNDEPGFFRDVRRDRRTPFMAFVFPRQAAPIQGRVHFDIEGVWLVNFGATAQVITLDFELMRVGDASQPGQHDAQVARVYLHRLPVSIRPGTELRWNPVLEDRQFDHVLAVPEQPTVVLALRRRSSSLCSTLPPQPAVISRERRTRCFTHVFMARNPVWSLWR